MKFSTKTRYGLRAMMEIAIAEPGTGVFQKDIAKNQDISVKYLDHIIAGLKAKELITNYKGKKSGYTLCRKAKDISVLDIHRAFEPSICVIDCLSRTVSCDRESHCAAKGFWGQLNQQIIEYFKSVNLQQIVDDQSLLDD